MTIQDIIHQADERIPNVIPEQQKIRWVAQAEGMLQLTRKPACSLPEQAETELTVPFPWDGLYLHHLEAEIYDALGQTARYNQAVARYHALYSGYRDWCNRSQLPEENNIRYG